jgi:hypothetical protein
LTLSRTFSDIKPDFRKISQSLQPDSNHFMASYGRNEQSTGRIEVLRASTNLLPAMALGAPVAAPVANTPVQTQLVRGPNVFERPYSIFSGYIMGQSLAYPTLSNDINALRLILHPIDVMNLDTQALINIFVPKSRYEIDALRYEYKAYSGEDLGTLLKQRLAGAESHVLYGFLGIALGMQNFDIWLMTHENVRLP